jgi:glycosyltransferase involved in cell wall biosynthesis
VTPTRRSTLARAGLACAAAQLALACLWTGASPVARGWLLLGGFGVLAVALFLARPRAPWAPVSITAAFAVFGGLSAVIATTEPGPAPGGTASFTYAVTATCLGGLVAAAAACAFGRYAGERLPVADPPAAVLRRVGIVVASVGLVGITAAMVRFAVSELPTDDLGAAAKSFWIGNTWLLLVANSAVVGLGLWFAGVSLGREAIRSYLVPSVLLVAFALALLPTGQRGFVIEFALIGVALVLARLGNRWWIGGLALAALLPFVVVTQAARNEVSETGSIRVESLVERLEPDRWSTLFGSQLASFRWTWDVAASRERIGAPNSFLQLPLKAIPRSILPDKSQGFGEEFTSALYPDAAADDVSFATPLVAESDYNGGLVAVAVVFALFGAVAGFCELFVGRGAPAALRPLWAAVLIFDGFMIVRGDLANAIVFTASLTIPLVVASVVLGFRPLPRRRRVVLDALQVPHETSGIGAQVTRIAGQLVPLAGDTLELRASCLTHQAVCGRLPPNVAFRLPVRRSRPRWLRIAYQQALAPVLDARSATIVCPGDQAPAWGRARVVLVVHDVRRLAHADAPFLERSFYRSIVPRGVRRAEAVMTVSEFSRSEIERLIGVAADKVRVLGHGVCPKAGAPGGRDGGPLLLVGAVRAYKGVDTLLAAILNLDESRRPDVVVAGSIDDQATLAAHTLHPELRRWVRFEGWVDEERLEELYREAAGTICPSRYEGYGLAVAESIARGLPTVASDIPSHREIAGDAALFFPAGDHEALARCLERVADPGARRAYAERAFRRAREIEASRPGWGTVFGEVIQAR